MDKVTAIIVTYHKDLEKFQTCLSGIINHGVMIDTIYAVINDDITAMPDFQKFEKLDNRVKILHHGQVAPWSLPLDWWSQQYFKIMIALLISTPWYLVIDSDDVIIQDLDADNLFDEGRARCLVSDTVRIIKSKTPDLIVWLENSRRVFGLSSLPQWTLGNLTPFMMHTDSVKKMARLIGPEMFDVRRPDGLCLEFFLYHAWLEKQNLLQELVSPASNLNYALDKRSIAC